MLDWPLSNLYSGFPEVKVSVGKIPLLVYKTHYGLRPKCISDLLLHHQPSRPVGSFDQACFMSQNSKLNTDPFSPLRSGPKSQRTVGQLQIAVLFKSRLETFYFILFL